MLPALDLLSRTYSLYKKHLWLYLGYAAWLLVPFAAFVILTFLPDHPAVLVAGILVSILELFLAIWLSLIFIRITAAIATRKPIDLQKTQKETLKLITSSVRIMLLQLIVFLGGLILFIVPGIVFGIWYAFSQQALVLDNKKDLEALSTSKALYKGRFLKLFWRLLFGPLCLAIIYSMVIGLIITIVAVAAGIDPIALYENNTLPLWVDIFEVIGEIFFVPLFAIYITLLYLHIKHLDRSEHLEKDKALS
jgi:hypothetical protein